MRALNFYSSNYHGHLLCRKKTCTIRLGDKTAKYSEGDIVWVTAGNRYSPRKKVFTGVLDRVQLKTIKELTPEDLRGESPDIRSHRDVVDYLSEIYGRTVSEDDTVTVIYFSEIIE
ncbi:MAG: RNA-binding protein [Clostridia bacterium]|nr:RNA-binding protein [Clostridia bacterium]